MGETSPTGHNSRRRQPAHFFRRQTDEAFPMFSLQTIFGQGMQFYTLLEAAATAAHDSTKALHTMLKDSQRSPALDAFKLARQREREASDKISQELVNSFITPMER